MGALLSRYCSWCHQKTKHKLHARNILSRNEYVCPACGNYSVECRFCKNMATFKPASPPSNEHLLKSMKTNWASELCAEHDGSVANFSGLNKQFNDLKNYKLLFERNKTNIAKVAKVSGGVIAGAAVFGPLAYLSAPGIAAWLGAEGLLGAAGTGIAIESLSGAALTNASLAAIGVKLGLSGMAGGSVLLTAIGTALGARQGGVISNSYFGSINDFEIIKVKKGHGPALIFVNGFLSQKNCDASDWLQGIKNKYPKNPCYLVRYEAKTLYEIGEVILKKGATEFLKRYAKKVGKKAGKRIHSLVNPLIWLDVIEILMKNPFHVAMYKASMTGILLADLLARTKQKDGFILLGHSMGARVIYYLLEALSSKDKAVIQDVYLFGGAVDGSDKKGWKQCAKAVNRKIYNFYSKNDNVLKIFYKAANLGLSDPIGYQAIKMRHPRIKNINCTRMIDNHMNYKKFLQELLSKI